MNFDDKLFLLSLPSLFPQIFLILNFDCLVGGGEFEGRGGGLIATDQIYLLQDRRVTGKNYRGCCCIYYCRYCCCCCCCGCYSSVINVTSIVEAVV